MKPTQYPPKIRIRFKTVTFTAPAHAVPAVSVRGPECALPLLAALFADLDATKEHFFVLSLNARNVITSWKHISTGTVNASIVHPREVFAPMVAVSAVAVILAHNHPSGDVDPSEDDLALTRRLVSVGELLGISVLDHLIIAPEPDSGPRSFASLKQAGYL